MTDRGDAVGRPRLRLSARIRLTLLYGGLVLATGMLLLGLNYVLVRSNVSPQEILFRAAAPPPGAPVHQGEVVPSPVDAGGRVVVEGVPLSPVEVQGLPARLKEAALDEMLVQSLIALSFMAAASLAIGWVVAGRVLRPVHDITATARRLSDENLHERLALDGPDDELKELADTFDEMLARLDAAFEAQGRFVGNASHELRTPLAILRAEVDVARRNPNVTREQLLEMADRIATVVDRSDHIIESLLTLAKAQRGLQDVEPVDAVSVADVAIAECEPLLAAAGVTCETSLEPVSVNGDGGLLEQAAVNLVANAAKYNVEGGTVWVRTRQGADGAAVLEVENTGLVVPPGQVSSLFEPFRRLAPDRTTHEGAGLGLSIVESVARAHGGRVEAEARRGGGLVVRIVVPKKHPL